MNYKAILDKLKYWKNYTGTGDEYRKTHDHDCVLTGGNLFADTIFSLWLPLRYTLNYFENPRWSHWKDFEASVLRPNKITLKDYDEFIVDLERNIEIFLPEHHLTYNLVKLFEIGQRRCNVMILPDRRWNLMRGRCPYFDYLPHYLYDLLDTPDLSYKEEIVNWIKRENLTMFFEDEIIDKEHIIDLAGTGCVYKHLPKNISLPFLIENYINLLQHRERLILSVA